MVVLKFLVVCGLVAAVVVDAEVVDTGPCGQLTSTCTVGQVRINPCKKAPKPCNLKKGNTYQMDFDFTPNFIASKLKANAYYPTPLAGDIKFSGFGSDDGCLYTTCPTVAGQQQLFNYTLSLGKKLPLGSYRFKWMVWNEDNKNEDVCCFATTVILK